MAEAMMRFVWFCAAGDSFFLGASLMILAVAFSTTSTGPAMNGVVRVALIAGLAHLSALGHRRMASAVAHLLGLAERGVKLDLLSCK
jgi:hypothetical protein